MTQLAELARPFEGRFVKTKPGSSGAAYVEHSDITQRLLQVVGPYGWELVEVVRGDVPEQTRFDRKKKENYTLPPLTNVVTGAVYRMTATVDGTVSVVEEVGEVEHPHNHTTDGSRLKFAASDAFKRCAMRLGLGLHLWAQDHYFLDRALAQTETDA